MRLVVRDAELDGRSVDLVVTDSRIADVGEGLASAGDLVVDAAGGAVLPGLHDHHIHLAALAAARNSVACGPPLVTDRAGLAAALQAAPVGGWIRGVGYHESVAGDLDRARLDAMVAHRPARVQHRSGHAWTLNTLALRLAGIDGDDLPAGVERGRSGAPTGRIFGLDGWLRTRVPSVEPDLAGVGRELGSYGVTGVTDATPTTAAADVELLATAVASGALSQRVVVTGGPGLAAVAAPALDRGPVKLVVADHQLPAFDDLLAGFEAARRLQRPVAVHCVTREALVLALAVWREMGGRAGDRIEHAAVVPVELIADIAELGLTVVTQPSFVAHRGDDYLRDVDPDDRPHLWRCASLLASGVPVGFSSDAPYGDPDPWTTVAAAIERRSPSGAIVGRGERVPGREALDRLLSPLEAPGGPPRQVRRGAPADLCLLDVPLARALADPRAAHVRMTMSAGNVIHGDSGRRS